MHLSIELTILLSGISVAAALYFGISNKTRNTKTDVKKESADMATVIVKLENIGNGVNEIKADMRNVREDVAENRERIVRVEASAKQAHKRIDELAGVRRYKDDED